MEDIWKKFKEETQESIKKINEFLNETSSNEKSQSNETAIIMNETSKINEQTQKIVLDNDTTEKIFDASRKNIYGKLRDMVIEIMENEHISRAQAYRKAKKRILNDQ